MSASARHLWLLTALSALLFFFNLGAAHLWDVDEAIFSQAAAEMYARGDYVVPYFNGHLFPDKPPLMYWLMISAFQVFGVNELAARFWSAAFGLGSVLLTYALGRRLFSARVGFWAALVLATNINFGIIARAATPDSLLTFFTTLSLWLFVRGVYGATPACGATTEPASQPLSTWREPGWGTYAWAYAAMAAGVMVKGPVGVVLPTAVLGLFLLCTRGACALERLPVASRPGGRWGRLGRLLDALLRTFAPGHFCRTVIGMRPLTAVLAVLLVAGPWYLWVGLRTNWQWPAEFFGVHNFGRFLNPMDNHRGPIVYYLGVILVLFFPWSIVIGGSVWELARRCARGSADRTGAVLVTSWLVVYLGFFSLASTKLPNYIIPCYPALALMTALFVERLIVAPQSVRRVWLGISLGCLGLAGLGILVAAPIASRLLAHSDWTLGLVGVVPLIGALAGCWFVVRHDYARTVATLGATAAGLSLWLFGATVVQADRFQNTQRFVDAIAEHGDGATVVASFRYFRPSMVFYGQRPIDKLARAEDVAAFFRDHPQSAFLYTLDEQLPQLAKLLPHDVTVLETDRRLFKGGKVLLLGRPADVARWPATAERPAGPEQPAAPRR